MEISGKLSISVGYEKTTLSIKDDNSKIQFLQCIIDNNEFLNAIGSKGLVECYCKLINTDVVGKKLVIDSMIFVVPKQDRELAIEIAKERCPQGWIPDEYFSSQDSFMYKDGKIFAKTTIRKWVE